MKTYKNSSQPYSTTDIEILENQLEWHKDFQERWLAHYQSTGVIDWDKYVQPRNISAPSGPGVALAQSKLMLVTSSGAYLRDSQEQFDDQSKIGDYSLRIFPSNTPFDQIEFAHSHYKHDYVNQDPQVLIPLRHLKNFAEEGLIGELAPYTLSFSGYQPNVDQLIKELIPKIIKTAKEMGVQAALLVPA